MMGNYATILCHKENGGVDNPSLDSKRSTSKFEGSDRNWFMFHFCVCLPWFFGLPHSKIWSIRQSFFWLAGQSPKIHNDFPSYFTFNLHFTWGIAHGNRHVNVNKLPVGRVVTDVRRVRSTPRPRRFRTPRDPTCCSSWWSWNGRYSGCFHEEQIILMLLLPLSSLLLLLLLWSL